jgi:hypothetical protein
LSQLCIELGGEFCTFVTSVTWLTKFARLSVRLQYQSFEESPDIAARRLYQEKPQDLKSCGFFIADVPGLRSIDNDVVNDA